MFDGAQPCTRGLVNFTCICNGGGVPWNELPRMDHLATDAESDAERPTLETQVDTQLTRALHRLAARSDSEPGATCTPTAVAVYERDDAIPRWRWPGWRPGPLGLGAAVALACFGMIALMHFHEPGAPAPSASEGFAIDRVIQFEGGATIISHGERDGETTWLHMFELNWSNQARPAARVVEDTDRIVPGKRELDVAEPIVELSGDRPVVPPRSTRRWSVPVRQLDRARGTIIKAGPDGKRPFAIIPPDR